MVDRYSLWAILPTKRSCVWWNSDITLLTIAKLLGWWWKILFWDISSLDNFHRKKSPHEVLNKFPPQKNIRSELSYRKLWEGQWDRYQLCVNDPMFTCLIINKASFSSHKLKPPTVLRAPWTVSFDHCIVLVFEDPSSIFHSGGINLHVHWWCVRLFFLLPSLPVFVIFPSKHMLCLLKGFVSVVFVAVLLFIINTLSGVTWNLMWPFPDA